jgi:crotonobetainyl-CoA:carnitine CoA-transferase CaiB-like acyl-CoA transferase
MADPNARGPLHDVRVLDLTEHMAGPYCAMILADMGAEVIKLERPGKGDSSRAMGDGSERNPYFRYINRNKKSLALDYKDARGREIFLKLVAAVDVLVENYRPTVMDRAGLGWDALSQVNPRLIYAQLSGFGSDGPYREKGGFDLIAQGMGGIMHVTGEPDGRRSACRSAISGQACGELRACWPRSTSASAPGEARRSSARCWRRRSLSRPGPARAGWPTAWSPCAWARGIARTRRTSGSKRRTAT